MGTYRHAHFFNYIFHQFFGNNGNNSKSLIENKLFTKGILHQKILKISLELFSKFWYSSNAVELREYDLFMTCFIFFF